MKNNVRTFDFYVLLFFILSFAGWVWEIAVNLILNQKLVNCGVYRGPYLPIYGTGGLLLWFLLQRYYLKPVRTFFLSMIICTIFEYMGSVLLEKAFGLRWWDYSNYTIQYEGRVCLIGAILFGLFGVMLNCVLLPLYMRLYHRLSLRKRWIICGILLVIFVLDVTYCTVNPNRSNSTQYEKILEK